MCFMHLNNITGKDALRCSKQQKKKKKEQQLHFKGQSILLKWKSESYPRVPRPRTNGPYLLVSPRPSFHPLPTHWAPWLINRKSGWQSQYLLCRLSYHYFIGRETVGHSQSRKGRIQPQVTWVKLLTRPLSKPTGHESLGWGLGTNVSTDSQVILM